MKFNSMRHKNPASARYTKFAVVRFKNGRRWLIGNAFGFTLIWKM